MTEDQRDRLMDFILTQQADATVKLDRLIEERQLDLKERELYFEAQRSNGAKLDRSERILKLMIRAGLRVRKTMREASDLSRQNTQDINALIDTVEHNSQSLNRLEAITQRNSEDIGRLERIVERNVGDIAELSTNR
jgi:hypothetical protein